MIDLREIAEDMKSFISADMRSAAFRCQDAMVKAQEMEAKLAEEERVCNDTMMALWEECKPCLKTTCVKYYSRTCSSGSGMVGHQVGTS